MKLFLTTAYPSQPHADIQLRYIKESAARYGDNKHRLSDDPEAADAILFAETSRVQDPLYLAVGRHPLKRKYAHKCFLYHDSDFVIPLMRGIYPSLSKTGTSGHAESFCYMARPEQGPRFSLTPTEQTRYLFSFIGRINCKVRADVMLLRHPQGLLIDCTNDNIWDVRSCSKDEYLARYTASITDSSFVLCPRGSGPSSFRLFEAMEAGRVPVIISDAWTAPIGPKWDEFSIRIGERDIPSLVDRLEDHRPRLPQMAMLARQAWEYWFAPDQCFPRICEILERLSQYDNAGRLGFTVDHILHSQNRRRFPQLAARSIRRIFTKF